ncbi:GNAT family N-acetyltransferase [Streptomyces niveiscabiei]|uniref:GNAT family N-acetyltransferase n=1 Tax=Streptomyces niveiscabiei TaxID=164115 RepID=UPI0006EBC756|nr:GNAT family N-acetyltransferase [Streptomyces niveiscabiei]
MIIVPAEEADLPRLIKFRTDAATWLRQRGTDQWARPFPPEHILASIRRREVYMIRETPFSDAAATLTLDRDADPRLWTPAEIAEPALYVHKLAVDRAASGRGLGGILLDWASVQAARQGARWLRLDAWTTNSRLQAYYRSEGFTHVRTADDPDVVSGWAAQRPASHQAHPEARHPVWYTDTPTSSH